VRALGHSVRYFVSASCAAASGQLFVAAERHGASAEVWLSAMALNVSSVLAVACYWGAA
jgi:hypothetical protein